MTKIMSKWEWIDGKSMIVAYKVTFTGTEIIETKLDIPPCEFRKELDKLLKSEAI